MPYTEQTWHDAPATDTPIDAARLTHIEDGIAAAAATADAAIPASETGAANGVATLDGGAHVPPGQLPAATASAQGTVELAGDLAGTATSPQVVGTHLASPLPLAQGGTGTTTGQPSGTAGGDLAGSYPNPTLAPTANVEAIIRANRLDQLTAPTSAVAMGGQKVTGLANGTASGDAAAFGQIPATLPPSGSAGGDLSGSYPNPAVTKLGGTKVTVSGTAPSSPSAGDVWVDTATPAVREYNGGGWQIMEAASPSMGYRPADITLVDKLFMGQSGGFSPTFSGTGATGNNTDTADFVVGTYAVKAITGGTGANTKISGTFGAALDLTGKCPVIWLKLENYAHFAGSYPRLYLGDLALSNVYMWKLSEATGQAWAIDGEWVRITLPFGTATVTGAPSRSSLAAMTLQVFDDAAGQVTMHLGGLATMPEPPQWPNGVVSLSFDDGYASQFSTAKPYMDKYGYRATAYVITETLWNHAAFSGYLDLASAQALEWYSGWEIASHAYTAANHNSGYVSIGQAAALADMQAAKDYLRVQGFRAPEMFAYPLGVYDSGTLADARRMFGSARTISSVGGFPDETFPPADLTRLRSVPVSANSVLATIESYVDQAAANREWLILTMHDIQASASGNLQLSTANFQALMDYIATKAIPVVPVSEVLKSSPKPSVTLTDIQSVGTANAVGTTGRPADAGHSHAVGLPLPADNGLLAANAPPLFGTIASGALVAGTIYVAKVQIRNPMTVSKVWLEVSTASSGASSGSFVGLYDSSGNRVAVSSDLASISAGNQSLTIPSTVLSPGFYWVAVLVNYATTQPSTRWLGSIVTPHNMNLAGSVLAMGTIGTVQTALPSSFAPASALVTTGGLPLWVGLS